MIIRGGASKNKTRTGFSLPLFNRHLDSKVISSLGGESRSYKTKLVLHYFFYFE